MQSWIHTTQRNSPVRVPEPSDCTHETERYKTQTWKVELESNLNRTPNSLCDIVQITDCL